MPSMNTFSALVCAMLLLSACVVVPEKDYDANYQCGLSSELKVLKLVNLNDGGTLFYEWQDEALAIITVPTSAVVSATYVAVNNIYHIGERTIKCS